MGLFQKWLSPKSPCPGVLLLPTMTIMRKREKWARNWGKGRNEVKGRGRNGQKGKRRERHG